VTWPIPGDDGLFLHYDYAEVDLSVLEELGAGNAGGRSRLVVFGPTAPPTVVDDSGDPADVDFGGAEWPGWPHVTVSADPETAVFFLAENGFLRWRAELVAGDRVSGEATGSGEDASLAELR